MGLLIDLLPSAGPALVVGGGTVAARKVRNLAEAEFEIVVVAPEVADEIANAPFTTVHRRPFADGDLELRDFSVVFACTDVREVNERVGRLARKARIPVVVADVANESTFYTPATIRQGEVAIAVSTGGASPVLARSLRQAIIEGLGPRWTQIALLINHEKEKRQLRRRAKQHEAAP